MPRSIGCAIFFSAPLLGCVLIKSSSVARLAEWPLRSKATELLRRRELQRYANTCRERVQQERVLLSVLVGHAAAEAVDADDCEHIALDAHKPRNSLSTEPMMA